MENLRLPVEMQTDLSAMLLYSDDLGIDGMVAIHTELMGINTYAEFIAEGSGDDPADIAETLEDADFLAHAVAWSGVMNPSASSSVDAGATSSVAEYEDDDGAAAGFDLAVSWITGDEELDAPEIGDQSVLVRTDSTDAADGATSVQLDYIFQVDNYVGLLTLAWFGDSIGDEYDADDMAEVAEIMIERMEQGSDDELPGLSLPLLRLEVSGDAEVVWQEEMYDMRGGEFVWTMFDTPDDMDHVIEFWQESGIDDYYRASTGFNLGDGSNGSYTNRAYDLGRTRAARSWIDDATTFFVEQDAAGGYEEIGEPEELSGFDVDVVGIRYNWAGEADGIRVWFQVDGIVYSMEADGSGGIDEDVLFELIEEQIECAEDGEYCEPIAIPEGLFL